MERWGHRQAPAPVQSPRHQGPKSGLSSSSEPSAERKKLVLAPRTSKPAGEEQTAAASPTSDKPKKASRYFIRP